ncbi:MAG TPA: transketolase C-terminal domain-containing protein [Nevskiaceae bacterium]|nr:transketolase C-terminal domain-containing protein [Nevskiaceae bacterium]
MSAHVLTMTTAAALNAALREAMARDPKVVPIGEDIADPAGGVMKVTAGLSTEFGHDRVRETPISEAGIMGAAVGAAMAGLRPVAEIMINDFMTIALDQLVNLAAKHHATTRGASKVPLTVRMGVASKLTSGATHSQSLEAWLMHIPGLKVGYPSNPADAKGMLAACILDDDPCVLFEDYMAYGTKGDVPSTPHTVPIGQADVKRPGSAVSILSYGWMMPQCLAAAEKLAAEGIDAEVVDLRWLLPLDEETILSSVAKTKRAVIVHAATRFAGPGAEIAAMIQEALFGQLKSPVLRVGVPFAPAPASAVLEAVFYPSVERIVAEVKKAVG